MIIDPLLLFLMALQSTLATCYWTAFYSAHKMRSIATDGARIPKADGITIGNIRARGLQNRRCSVYAAAAMRPLAVSTAETCRYVGMAAMTSRVTDVIVTRPSQSNSGGRPVLFVAKRYLYFSIGNGQSGEPALCQLYRHTFVPCAD